jgi:hypothetical protein
MSFKKNTPRFLFISLAFVGCGVVAYYTLPAFLSIFNGNSIEYTINQDLPKVDSKVIKNSTGDIKAENLISGNGPDNSIPVTHIATPSVVKALYMSSWVAGSEDFRNSLIKIVDDTELNAVVIDVKDSTGRVSYYTDDSDIQKIGSSEKRIPNIRALTALLHSKNIYVIGRISTFQDSYLTKLKPEWAIKKLSDGGVWKDKKGMSFLDPTNPDVHKYILSIALNAYKEGFDEINFDYIRYPSDGDISNINYNLVSGKTRSDNLAEFFKYINTEIKKTNNIPISADVFGLTTEATDDMGIGQVWEKIIPYFDFVCPMVYPSHYAPGYDNYKNPALYPYEVVNKALTGAVIKTKAISQNILKIRPWLQDFDLGATYTKDMIKAQIKAVYDNGLNSWLLWDPSNKYTPSALELVTIN